MTRILWFVRSLLIYLAISSIHSNGYDPLIFNPYTLEIYNLDEINSNKLYFEPCAVACPDENEPVQNIKHFYRYIFIHSVFRSHVQKDMISGMKCKRDFQLSLLRHPKENGKRVEFGFMVLFEESKFRSEQIRTDNITDFDAVANGESILWSMRTWLRRHSPISWILRKMTKQKWRFLWLSKIKMYYNYSSRILKSLRYKVRSINPNQLNVSCDNYDLHGTWYNKDAHLAKLYTNQMKIFKRVQTQSSGRCRPNYQFGECVRKHNLVLPYHFQAASPHKVSCSNLTTIPLWHKIPESFMNRMQIFDIAVAQVLGNEKTLIVLLGVLGPLTLPSEIGDTPTKIYLDDEEKKVPVPEIIYKVVRYRTYRCDEKKGELCWFDVVIVIHNHLEFTEDEKLCPEDQCKRVGWDSIQYLNSNKLGHKFSFVYCCELNEIIAKSIGFPLGKTRNEVLNLKGIPSYVPSYRAHARENMMNAIKMKFSELVEEFYSNR